MNPIDKVVNVDLLCAVFWTCLKMVCFQVGAKAGPITNQSKETEVLLTMLSEM